MSNNYGYPQLTPEQCEAFAIRTQRAAFQAQPPDKQAETLTRVALLLEAERRRGQKQPSYLARHAQEIYGV